MFEKYDTIDEIMSFAKDLVQKELNNTPLYVHAVNIMRYQEIGIEVLDDHGRKFSNYASHNYTNGKIDKIVKGFKNPKIIVKVKENTLLEILHNVEKIKKHPIISFFQYAPKFRPKRVKDYTELLKMTASIPKIFKNYEPIENQIKYNR